MGSFQIEGGHRLKGNITPQGAKNEALQILCAVLLTEETVTISNIPDIVDVNKLIGLLKKMGVKVTFLEKGKYAFTADAVDLNFLDTQDYKTHAKQLRGSVMLVGPMLSKYGKGSIPRPGGDKIGRRRLDTHFEGLKLTLTLLEISHLEQLNSKVSASLSISFPCLKIGRLIKKVDIN